MTNAIHLIQNKQNGRPKLVSRPDIYDCGTWALLSADDANRLIGGHLYYHEARAQPSFFGGEVLSWRYGERDDGGQGIVFRVKSTREGKRRPWVGRDDQRAWCSGIVQE